MNLSHIMGGGKSCAFNHLKTDMSKTSQRKQAKKQDDAALRFKIRIGGGVIGPVKVRLLEEIVALY